LVELLHQISKKFFLVFAKEAALQTKAVLAQIKQRFIRKRKKKRKGCKKKCNFSPAKLPKKNSDTLSLKQPILI
jgi:hypothetical protein